MNDQSETFRRRAAGTAGLPAPCGPAADTQGGDPHPGRTRPEAGFAAQMLGAAGQRRGLKGGAPVLQAARRAYLEAEWSGPGDRRAGRGVRALARI